MSKALRDYDEEEIRYCKEDIDTLLVFVGSFLPLGALRSHSIR